MNSLFSPNSKFMQVMGRVADLIILNLCFLITCIPIFTIGAARTALYTVIFRITAEKDPSVFKSYFRAFRDNFKQSTGLWLVLLAIGVSALFNIRLFYLLPGSLHYCFILFAIVFLVVLLISALVFPLLSQFNTTGREALKNAFFLSLGYLPRAFLVAVLDCFPAIVFLIDAILFMQTGFMWLILYFSAAAYLATYLLHKIFAPYMTDEQQEE